MNVGRLTESSFLKYGRYWFIDRYCSRERFKWGDYALNEITDFVGTRRWLEYLSRHECRETH